LASDAIAVGKADIDDGNPSVIPRGVPNDTGFPHRTSGLLGFPINRKTGHAKARCRTRLPTCILPYRAQQINLALVAGHQMIGNHIPGIDDMFTGEQIALSQVGMNDIGHRVVNRGRVGGFHIGNHMRQVVITRFSEVDFVSKPVRIPFLTPARIRIIGRTDQLRGGGKILCHPPANRLSRV
jgi:hypothetical protein